jgi:hypothetical protein
MASHTPRNDNTIALFDALNKALGLPKHVSEFELRIAVDEMPTVKLRYSVMDIGADGISALKELSGKFVLTDCPPNEDK